jgi:hypothetical protein
MVSYHAIEKTAFHFLTVADNSLKHFFTERNFFLMITIKIFINKLYRKTYIQINYM